MPPELRRGRSGSVGGSLPNGSAAGAPAGLRPAAGAPASPRRSLGDAPAPRPAPSPRHNYLGEGLLALQSRDARLRSLKTRTTSTLLMVAGFVAILYAGHVVVCVFIMCIQARLVPRCLAHAHSRPRLSLFCPDGDGG